MMTSFKILIVLLFVVFVLSPEDFGANAWGRRRRRRRRTIGIPGPQGPQGPQGPRGPRGYRGFTGQRGFPGLQGPPGPRGFRGLRGYRGFTGRPGNRGLRGFRGFPGRPSPARILKCSSHRSISTNVVRCPLRTRSQVVSCSCHTYAYCTKRYIARGRTCQCVCRKSRPTAICCKV